MSITPQLIKNYLRDSPVGGEQGRSVIVNHTENTHYFPYLIQGVCCSPGGESRPAFEFFHIFQTSNPVLNLILLT